MEPLKEYCKLKPMSGEERSNYFLSYMSMINDNYIFLKVLKDFINIFILLDRDEMAELMAKYEKLKQKINSGKTNGAREEQGSTNNNASQEARVIPLFPKNPGVRR